MLKHPHIETQYTPRVGKGERGGGRNRGRTQGGRAGGGERGAEGGGRERERL